MPQLFLRQEYNIRSHFFSHPASWPRSVGAPRKGKPQRAPHTCNGNSRHHRQCVETHLAEGLPLSRWQAITARRPPKPPRSDLRPPKPPRSDLPSLAHNISQHQYNAAVSTLPGQSTPGCQRSDSMIIGVSAHAKRRTLRRSPHRREQATYGY